MPKKMHPIGDGPVEDRFRATMEAVCVGLDDIFNPGLSAPNKTVGFVLLVFPYGSGDGRCNYMSNGANREDVLVLLKEQVRRFEGAPDVSGTA